MQINKNEAYYVWNIYDVWFRILEYGLIPKDLLIIHLYVQKYQFYY